MKFDLIAIDKKSKARAGIIHTDRGIIETPIFMPVGTQGTVKAVSQKSLKDEIHAQIILGNTYHLYLRPGCEILEKAGGLHSFMNWNLPILTDSGGYQVFSLSDLRKINNEGVEFKSHLDGSSHFFTPERAIEIQRKIGSDIMMPLDECAPFPCEYEYADKSTDLTSRWALRNKEAFIKSTPLYGKRQFLFGIIQGAVFKDLRERSAKDLIAMDFDGYSIGGLAVGEPAETMYQIVDFTTDIIPINKPRYLMGVGRPENILECIERGVDMFDCVMPTRNARNASLFTSKGILSMRNSKYKDDFSPVDENCSCYCCSNFSRAYLRHLFISKEIFALELASLHNLTFYLKLIKEAREKVIENNYLEWKESIINKISKNNIISED